MGFCFQRRIKIMPGVTLNVGKRGGTTDVYRVNPATGEILRLEKNGSMQVAENTRKDGSGSTYHVLRDLK